jgi:hypothetical protein
MNYANELWMNIYMNELHLSCENDVCDNDIFIKKMHNKIKNQYFIIVFFFFIEHVV